MSLVIAFAGSKQAIIGGDRRSITFLRSSPELEKDLYSGRLKTDEDLLRRAGELGAFLQVADDREKVWRRGDVLVGEVTERSIASDRRRRIYLVPGAYLLADINGSEAKVTALGGSACCMVLGNEISQRLAREGLKKAKEKVSEAVIRAILVEASTRTPSVSSDHMVFCIEVQPQNPEEAVYKAFQEDCCKSGWRPCGRQ